MCIGIHKEITLMTIIKLNYDIGQETFRSFSAEKNNMIIYFVRKTRESFFFFILKYPFRIASQ